MNAWTANAPISAMKSDFLAPVSTQIIGNKQESPDTNTLEILLPDGYPKWHSGQFNMLYVFGMGEVPLSISGLGSKQKSIFHTIKAVGPVTTALTKLNIGDEVWIRGPFGSAWPNLAKDADLVIVAGGIGIAPLRPVIFSALNNNNRRRVIILYGSRTPTDVLYKNDLKIWSSDPDACVEVTVDRIDSSIDANDPPWDGSVGFVTTLLSSFDFDPQRTVAMTCGPDIMMRYAASELLSRGISNQNIFVSLERNMKCAVGVCGRCQWGPQFLCRDGPVYSLANIHRFWNVNEF